MECYSNWYDKGMILNTPELEEECLICFNNIQVDTCEYILLECCNKQVHIDCLSSWIKSCDNMHKLNCPYCRQKSLLCNDIYNSLTIQNISHNIDVSNEDTNNLAIINVNDDYHYCIFSKCIYKICTIIIIIAFVETLFCIIYT